MHPHSRTRGALWALIALVFVAVPGVVTADDDGTVQNQISVYTGDNAIGYLQPLANAIGATLNSAFGYSAYIPKTSFHIGLEVPVMGLFFEDADKKFLATTESGFDPTTQVEVPTVVGDGSAVVVDGTGGAQFAFPGGLQLNSFGLAVPQLRLSSLAGTEAVVRWVAYDQGDADVGKIDMFGIGGRHSISQYMGENPSFDIAVGLLYQTFEVGENDLGNPFVDSSALNIQAQASKRMPVGFATFEPYGVVQWESLDLDVQYSDTNDEPVAVSMEAENSFRFTLGAGLNFVAGQVWADYSFSDVSNFSFGLALGNLGRQ
ncbi:MAG: autotransporter domain-containing protein [Candidatus Latescibacteria bacterium]|nr:autotransporter domain-containing protein [Candidatus Latescibacterota bacterium]